MATGRSSSATTPRKRRPSERTRSHQFRGFSPAQRDDIVQALGEKVTVQESPWNCGLVVAVNHEKKPFSDRRVRRALARARPLRGGQERCPRPPSSAKWPACRSRLAVRHFARRARQARRLRAEHPGITSQSAPPAGQAGVASPFSFVLKNRNIPMPYEVVGTWLVNQWREIGLKVSQETQESSPYFKDLRAGNFEVSTDFQCGYVVDPDLDLYKFQSQKRATPTTDATPIPSSMTSTWPRSRTVDPDQRRRHIKAFEKRLLDEEALYLHAPVAPHRAAQLAGAWLDHHAEPLSQQPARHGMAGAVTAHPLRGGFISP